MSSIEIAGGVILLIVVALIWAGGGSRGRSGVWSGDTRDEEARRNTRTDSNYQGYDRWQNNHTRGDW